MTSRDFAHRSLLAVAGAAILTLGLGACDEGPAEQAGEKVDEAVEDAGRAADDATD